METEQAHSSQTFPLPRHRDTGSRPLRTARRVFPTRDRAPVVWLNLVCLDAPLVAVGWLCLFARTFRATVEPSSYGALFLTAWLIYLADRLADSYSLPEDRPRSLRHQFCLNHRRTWIGALALIAAMDAQLVWRSIAGEIFVAGVVVGAVALVHLVLNYSLGGSWPPLPLKEFAIGFLFAAGTLVALSPALRPISSALVLSSLAFASLCTLNCISIAFWERELDETQRKVSFATRYPSLDWHLGKLLSALALIAGAAAIIDREAAPILGCVSVSSLLLALLDFCRGKISRDQRTALADIVLLTPLLALLIMHA